MAYYVKNPEYAYHIKRPLITTETEVNKIIPVLQAFVVVDPPTEYFLCLKKPNTNLSSTILHKCRENKLCDH